MLGSYFLLFAGPVSLSAQENPRRFPDLDKTPAAGKTKPNIVFLLTDNLGFGELSVYGGGILRGAPTPRIDKLASEGMRLLNFNVEAQCTPTRSALMDGTFPDPVRDVRSARRWRTRQTGRADTVGDHHRRAFVGTGLCHRHVGEMASRQHRGAIPDAPGLRRMVFRIPCPPPRPAS